MQRLFSTFPDSWPGLGLLILRASTAWTVIYAHHVGTPNAQTDDVVRNVVAILIATFVLVGFCVPYAATAIVILLLIDVITSSSFRPDDILLIGIGLCLTMIGPGAWSIDALLFGRRRIDIKPR